VLGGTFKLRQKAKRHFEKSTLFLLSASRRWYYPSMLPIILVRGSGDVGSAVAHTLFKADYAVVIHDSAKPSATRRKMAFCDAIFEGKAALDGVNARLFNGIPELTAGLTAHDLVPLTTLDLSRILAALKPGVLVDARMRKHEQPEVQITLAPFTVGLGPSFIAGETVHAAVETGWNEELGKVIWKGATRPLEGEPLTIAGHARDRYVYSPAAGMFYTALQVGDMVSAGQEVARVDEIPLYAPINGILRGLTHDGVPIARKSKVIEVDPRGTQAQISGIAERPRRIARGVLEAIKTWEGGLSA
jgi:xanthine dehydrogenase accessory factor